MSAHQFQAAKNCEQGACLIKVPAHLTLPLPYTDSAGSAKARPSHVHASCSSVIPSSVVSLFSRAQYGVYKLLHCRFSAPWLLRQVIFHGLLPSMCGAPAQSKDDASYESKSSSTSSCHHSPARQDSDVTAFPFMRSQPGPADVLSGLCRDVNAHKSEESGSTKLVGAFWERGLAN
eukprot:749555-Pelagomonas_calceolata.AAC.4